mmetsp:Transcript_30015/g.44482  ORF Transcript_30015/g.44482 Transcript_30015/m.44482 type:complete len:1136 (-) Transcript_30015:138-3545(-)|eukprot:CAMPEP_0195509414 /NCGR_PEP_ID=MMETSP0794_2-20130614/2358_1 /TAXON_ID=515487 /ORGANISM="Stephanopyxis turris, Strain CCMP 815" /LENGTH=1135 /DNA_ID=CAMNT_0040636629 /DNA_START=68 /DNA_END=3475 /DNA_ORIENTATION=-
MMRRIPSFTKARTILVTLILTTTTRIRTRNISFLVLEVGAQQDATVSYINVVHDVGLGNDNNDRYINAMTDAFFPPYGEQSLNDDDEYEDEYEDGYFWAQEDDHNGSEEEDYDDQEVSTPSSSLDDDDDDDEVYFEKKEEEEAIEKISVSEEEDGGEESIEIGTNNDHRNDDDNGRYYEEKNVVDSKGEEEGEETVEIDTHKIEHDKVTGEEQTIIMKEGKEITSSKDKFNITTTTKKEEEELVVPTTTMESSSSSSSLEVESNTDEEEKEELLMPTPSSSNVQDPTILMSSILKDEPQEVEDNVIDESTSGAADTESPHLQREEDIKAEIEEAADNSALQQEQPERDGDYEGDGSENEENDDQDNVNDVSQDSTTIDDEGKEDTPEKDVVAHDAEDEANVDAEAEVDAAEVENVIPTTGNGVEIAKDEEEDGKETKTSTLQDEEAEKDVDCDVDGSDENDDDLYNFADFEENATTTDSKDEVETERIESNVELIATDEIVMDDKEADTVGTTVNDDTNVEGGHDDTATVVSDVDTSTHEHEKEEEEKKYSDYEKHSSGDKKSTNDNNNETLTLNGKQEHDSKSEGIVDTQNETIHSVDNGDGDVLNITDTETSVDVDTMCDTDITSDDIEPKTATDAEMDVADRLNNDTLTADKSTTNNNDQSPPPTPSLEQSEGDNKENKSQDNTTTTSETLVHTPPSPLVESDNDDLDVVADRQQHILSPATEQTKKAKVDDGKHPISSLTEKETNATSSTTKHSSKTEMHQPTTKTNPIPEHILKQGQKQTPSPKTISKPFSSSDITTKKTNTDKNSNDIFLSGLDDFDKFLENVDVPDELDVAAGSSMQEVLSEKTIQIASKRIVNSLKKVTKQLKRLGDMYMDWYTRKNPFNKIMENDIVVDLMEKVEDLLSKREGFERYAENVSKKIQKLYEKLLDVIGMERDDDDDDDDDDEDGDWKEKLLKKHEDLRDIQKDLGDIKSTIVNDIVSKVNNDDKTNNSATADGNINKDSDDSDTTSELQNMRNKFMKQKMQRGGGGDTQQQQDDDPVAKLMAAQNKQTDRSAAIAKMMKEREQQQQQQQRAVSASAADSDGASSSTAKQRGKITISSDSDAAATVDTTSSSSATTATTTTTSGSTKE